MVLPDEFCRLSSCFIQDRYTWGVKHPTEWIKHALELTHLPPSGVQRLKDFLDQLLSQSDDKLIEDAWLSTSPNWTMFGGDVVRRFLTEVRQLMDVVEIKGMPGVP
jgi:hypothetical protein